VDQKMMWCERCQVTVNARQGTNPMMKKIGLLVMALAVPEAAIFLWFLPAGPIQFVGAAGIFISSIMSGLILIRMHAGFRCPVCGGPTPTERPAPRTDFTRV